MPTEAENVQFLYLVLTNDGTPNIEWDKVGAALDLNKGATTKRWSRLKQSMDKGEMPSGAAYQFLWLCVKHSSHDKAMNWPEIAKKCNTTKGAAVKRYSRMKLAFEKGVPPSGVTTNSQNTPVKKAKATTYSEKNHEASITETPKRKRNTPKKKAPVAEEQKFKPEPEDYNTGFSDEESKPKRAKATKAKAKPKSNANDKSKTKNPVKQCVNPSTPTTEASTLIKNEHDEDAFYDANEEANGLLLDDHEDREDTVDRVQGWLEMSG